MGYAIVLYFDENSEIIIRDMWKLLYDNNINKLMHDSNSRPHITLAIYDEDLYDLDNFINSVEDYAKTLKPFKLIVSNIGMFNTNEGVAFLAPKVTGELLDIHYKLYEGLKQYAEFAWNYYIPDNWIPHCTIAIELSKEKLLQSIEVLSDIFSPFDITIEKLGIVKFSPVEYVSIFDL